MKGFLKWKKYFKEYSISLEKYYKDKIWFYIFLSTAVSLYFELMLIRLHSSFFQLFAYYKNITLLSCFLGLGIGFALKKKNILTPIIIPLFTLQIILLYILKLSKYKNLFQNPVPENLTMGLGYVKNIQHFIIVLLFIVFFFILNALCFIPLGQIISYFMQKMDKLKSYSFNLLGSLAGIILFSFISYLCLPPIIWILLGSIGIIYFLSTNSKYWIPSIISIGTIFIIFHFPLRLNNYDIYSPYQVLTVTFRKNLYPEIKVNNVYFQHIINFSEEKGEWFEHYSIPYFFIKNPENVLIVGIGSGNDVAASLHYKAHSIDAVEIDPIIFKLGKFFHPNSPYNKKNVKVFINDARAYIQNCSKKYDLIIYGLLDSHTLLSGLGSIRLDSYVYTIQAFKDAKKLLKENGLISLSFYVLSPSIAKKIYIMLKEAFDEKSPIVYQIGESKRFVFLIGKNLDTKNLPKIKGAKEITKDLEKLSIRVDKSTDDWPFLYMSFRKIPLNYVIILGVILLISLIMINIFLKRETKGFSIPAFFLGVGFMLLETKAITELALIFGTTWMVNSIVISAVLLMAFLANILVIKNYVPSKTLIYIFLTISIILGLIFSQNSKLKFQIRYIIMPLILTLPLFFSGFAFSNELKRVKTVSIALYSNLLGSMLGGVLEYNSLYFGFKFLYILAILMYIMAFISSKIKIKNEI